MDDDFTKRLRAATLLSIKEVALRLGLTSERVRQLERAGKIPAMRTTAGTRIFFEEDVVALQRARAAKAAP